jgi:hypothetical protein
MIKSFIKTFGLFIFFLMLMSITVDRKPLFSHIYSVTSPLTQSAQELTEDFFAKSMASTKVYSQKLFDNSVPKVRDAVGSKLSSHKKTLQQIPSEEVTPQEKAQLDDLIKNY